MRRLKGCLDSSASTAWDFVDLLWKSLLTPHNSYSPPFHMVLTGLHHSPPPPPPPPSLKFLHTNSSLACTRVRGNHHIHLLSFIFSGSFHNHNEVENDEGGDRNRASEEYSNREETKKEYINDNPSKRNGIKTEVSEIDARTESSVSMAANIHHASRETIAETETKTLPKAKTNPIILEDSGVVMEYDFIVDEPKKDNVKVSSKNTKTLHETGKKISHSKSSDNENSSHNNSTHPIIGSSQAKPVSGIQQSSNTTQHNEGALAPATQNKTVPQESRHNESFSRNELVQHDSVLDYDGLEYDEYDSATRPSGHSQDGIDVDDFKLIEKDVSKRAGDERTTYHEGEEALEMFNDIMKQENTNNSSPTWFIGSWGEVSF